MHAFASIDPSLYSRVVVLGPTHYQSFANCVIPDATSAETPNGAIPFDIECCESLLSRHPTLFKKIEARTAEQEHSLEMEFPLLRFVFGERLCRIVPIIVGDCTVDGAAKIAAALREFTDDPETLVVVSTDFCHWGTQFRYTRLPPGEGEIYERIERLDRQAADAIASGMPRRFAAYLRQTGNTICGRNAILVMMNLYDEFRAEFPAYAKSKNITSDRDSSVSYFAGIIRT
jgi:AmmeMemoRadiSam system protein B